MKSFFIFIISLLLINCDSPMNHRVDASASSNLMAQSLFFSKFSLYIEIQWLVGPIGNINKSSHLLAVLKDSTGQPVALPEGYSLQFYSTMPSMGHPMDDAGYFEAISDGIYLNKNIKFNMDGDWKHEIWIIDQNFKTEDKIEWYEFF